MKYVLLFLILPVLTFAQADKSVVSSNEWLTSYETAMNEAVASDKNVMVYFTGSDWCPPCKMLKTDLFDSAEFAALSKNYVLLYIDIPMNKDLLTPEQLAHNKELSSRMNKKGSVPLIKILDKKGQLLDKYAGYSMNGDTRYHIEIIEKHQAILK